MKTIVLDDDPTGTQSATGVTVLLESDADLLTEALRHGRQRVRADQQPRTRRGDRRGADHAGSAPTARRPAATPRREVRVRAARRLHTARTRVRRDRGLPRRRRGHAVRAGVPRRRAHHPRRRALVRVDGVEVPAHESEYADDPVFGFSTARPRRLRGGEVGPRRRSRSRSTTVRARCRCARVGDRRAPAGAVIAPTRSTPTTSLTIARAVDARPARGRETVVVRSAAPLAAELAGVTSRSCSDFRWSPSPGRSCSCADRTPRARPRQLEPWSSTWWVPRPSSTRMPRCANPSPQAWPPPRRRARTSRPARSPS